MDVQKWVDHYVWMASIDKRTAWQLANEAAARCEMLRDLPRLLTEAMREAGVRKAAGQGKRKGSD